MITSSIRMTLYRVGLTGSHHCGVGYGEIGLLVYARLRVRVHASMYISSLSYD